MSFLVPMVLMFVMLYFLLIRPQRKRQAELQKQIDGMKVGDAVVTAGGIHGIVSNKADTTVTVKVADNVKIRFDKSSVAKVMPRNKGEGEEEASSGEAEGSEEKKND